MESLKTIVGRHGKDRTELLAMIRDVQASHGHVPPEAVAELAGALGLSEADVEGVVTFYHFFSLVPAGTYAVHLNDSITARMSGRSAVARAFEQAAGCRFGETTPDGLIGLHDTSCIGMNDQEPAAIINGVVFTRLTEASARDLVAAMKAGTPVVRHGHGPRATAGPTSPSWSGRWSRTISVKKGPVLFGPFTSGSAVRKAATLKPEGVIDEVKKANLLGRGGAGFPTGLKWEFCRKEKGPKHYVVCNADEGEPGTFKDRVILTELPRLVFEGMAVAGYAIGAEEGILYLRAEYAYLQGAPRERPRRAAPGEGPRQVDRRDQGLQFRHQDQAGRRRLCLRRGIGPHRIRRRQAGRAPRPAAVPRPDRLPGQAHDRQQRRDAGARPPSIVAQDAGWFKSMGIPNSAGTKLLSVSGDCARPGHLRGRVRTVRPGAPGPGRRARRAGRPGGRALGQLHRAEGLREEALVHRSSDRRLDHRLRPRPGPVRDRPQLHGILRRGIVRLVHALPGREPHPAPEVRQDRRGQGLAPGPRGDRELGKDHQDHEPLRPRPDVPQPHPDDPQELPPSSTRPGSARTTTSSPNSTWPRPWPPDARPPEGHLPARRTPHE